MPPMPAVTACRKRNELNTCKSRRPYGATNVVVQVDSNEPSRSGPEAMAVAFATLPIGILYDSSNAV